MHNATEAIMSGLCLDKVTAVFPKYPLHKVEKNVQGLCLKLGGQELINKLPKCPKEVGGETDFMIGIKYFKYFAKEVFKLPSGLTIYESFFRGKMRQQVF